MQKHQGNAVELLILQAMNKYDTKYLQSLIDEGEHQQLDFKFEISDARKIARTLSAFSNTDGGRLLVGVKDNGRISGVRSDEEYYMAESAAQLYCTPEVQFEPRNHRVDGKNVLEIYIPPVGQKPVYARDHENRWIAYVRVADQNILAGIIQIHLWKEEKEVLGSLLEYTRSEEILLRYLESFPEASLSKTQRDTGYRRKELVSLITRLVRFDVIKMGYKNGAFRFSLSDKPGYK